MSSSDPATLAGSGNVGRMFAAQAQRRPCDIALACDDATLSYSQLNARVNRLAQVMLAQGTGRGDRVGLLARNCLSFIEVELAAAKIGAITVSLNWRLSPVELRHCLQLTEPRIIFAQAGYVEHLDQTGLSGTNRLVFGDDYEAALAKAPATEPRAGGAGHAGGEDGLVIIFTSGTTGLPKGALISHRAMIARGMIYGAETGAPAKDTFVAWTPLFHMGANDFALATLLRGGKVIIVDGYQPVVLINAIKTENIHCQ
ncbi:MAG: AMP-binding protein [Proteobacteria bacterium]|nr:AMP-binding protein [Pseudomonadota bacterium]